MTFIINCQGKGFWLFFFFGYAHDGQGWNPHHNTNQSHSGDKAISPNCWTTKELLVLFFKYSRPKFHACMNIYIYIYIHTHTYTHTHTHNGETSIPIAKERNQKEERSHTGSRQAWDLAGKIPLDFKAQE